MGGGGVNSLSNKLNTLNVTFSEFKRKFIEPSAIHIAQKCKINNLDRYHYL